MRISSSWSQQLGINALIEQESKKNHTQIQLSTGKRIIEPSDDPAAAVQVVDLNQTIKQTEQYNSNIKTARQRIELEEVVLQSSVDVMHRLRDLGLQGLNATNSLGERKAVAQEMELLNGQLVGLANTKNSNGEFIFSGFKSDQTPFVETAVGVYTYGGDANQRQIQISTTRQIADGDPGDTVFGIPSGGPPAVPVPLPGSISNIFEAVAKFAADMKAGTPNVNSLTDLANSLDKMLTAQSSVGARLNALDTQEGVNNDYVMSMNSTLSSVEDLDYASAISKFNLQSTTLEGARQAFSKVQHLSLFNYL
jgi:flagellar hook-associated protein 3 FlgL